MSDSEGLFEFVPGDLTQRVARNIQKNYVENSHARKKASPEVACYSYIKRSCTRGIKIIRLEIYDVDSTNMSKIEHSLCDCSADLCVQHIVKSPMFDDIYISARELVNKIQANLDI